MSTMRVLFVEDDSLMLECYREFAARKGWQAQHARSVDKARDLLTRAEHPFTAIVLDHQIWNGMGYQLLPDIQKHHPTALVVSASSMATLESEYPGIPWKSKGEVCKWIHDTLKEAR